MTKNIRLHIHPHGGHSHPHDHADRPGHFHESELPLGRVFRQCAFTVGVCGPLGGGKTALMPQLCKRLRATMNIAAVTNDVFTRKDAGFLTRHDTLPADRIRSNR